MSEPTLFTRAYVRGLNAELVRSNALHYPSKMAADAAADYVAKTASVPDVLTQGDQITLEVATSICEKLAEAAHVLCTREGQYDTTLSKTASAYDPKDLAANEALDLMDKVAHENTQPAVASTSELAQQDLAARPMGYATGGAEAPVRGPGEIGTQTPVALPKGDSTNRGPEYAAHRPTFETPGAEVGMEQKVAHARLQKTAARVVPFLHDSMTDREKLAHVTAMSGLTARGQAKYLGNMYEAYGADKTAAWAYAEAFYKKASEEEAQGASDDVEDLEVAQAIERAAEQLEERAEEHVGDHTEDVAEAAKEASVKRLAAAAANITRR